MLSINIWQTTRTDAFSKPAMLLQCALALLVGNVLLVSTEGVEEVEQLIDI